MNRPIYKGLSYDESVSLGRLYLMADAAYGSSDILLSVRASDLLRVTKRMMRDHPIDWETRS